MEEYRSIESDLQVVFLMAQKGRQCGQKVAGTIQINGLAIRPVSSHRDGLFCIRVGVIIPDDPLMTEAVISQKQ